MSRSVLFNNHVLGVINEKTNFATGTQNYTVEKVRHPGVQNNYSELELIALREQIIKNRTALEEEIRGLTKSFKL